MTSKIAVVTGGSGVLGKVFCQALIQNNYKVAIIGRSLEKSQMVAKEITQNGGVAIGFAADVTDIQSLNTVSSLIQDKLGSCDLLINAAGGNHPKGVSSEEYYYKDKSIYKSVDATDFFDLDPIGIDFVFKLNFMGTLLPTQVFAKQMLNKDNATIINISSVSAVSPLTRVVSYSAAKSAIDSFTKWLAIHLSRTNIRVNAIAPGFFLTEQNHKLLLNEDGSFTQRAEKILAKTPMGRFGDPRELIGVLLWLANHDMSSFVNGAVIPVDGGFTAYSGV